ncbi:MAG: FAD-dependent oxidoreductase [Gammaproteobacteria bacterium]|nr:FAD-dependent oxidoreductase [Gammaproteobacteria bacterium]
MTKHYDIVVIGGGIHGVGVAQAAVAAGYSVALIEKTALAAGTSSKSSKLIHGGLRYLESLELSLVRECLLERHLLLKLAPELVQLRDFNIPIYRATKRRAWQIRAGLSLYALLGNFHSSTRFKSLPKSQWDQLDGLTTNNLQRVFRYQDAQTDDKKLVEAVMKSAQSLDADLLMPAKVVHATADGTGCTVAIEQNQSQTEIRANMLVNAAGPWINDVASKISPKPSQVNIDWVQGTHMVVRGKLSQGIYYVESPTDGRAVFVMPWYGKTMIGTTEKLLDQDINTIENIAPSTAEVDYLKTTLQHYFPSYHLPEDIEDSWAGARVLPTSKKSAFKRSRETIFYIDRQQTPRVLSLYGGKLTAYRATAEKALRKIEPLLPKRQKRADTKKLKLT